MHKQGYLFISRFFANESFYFMILTPFLVVLSWACISAVLFVLTFIFYLAITNLRDTKDAGRFETVHLSVRWTCYAILFAGLILDTLLNWIFLSITYLEFPREFLSTARVVRHKYHGHGWRRAQSIWWCRNWLSPFDLRHCEK
ncbi:MAG: hypothetical protein B7Y56_05525 [Gallionellales bacterium 35-53-114]|nr:MAG: hypothetical protein B7Y56_05525 [Gallionellales bacterium 35-53-114]OYZ63668.1 MAG: hypothetical protein B7Y04_06635 [Gallionellales bacterium 24-53-125]OZB09499.1 MAG: hypothetical protein B7X61_07580 [Gallionellales bacterium 39-52-133]